MLSIVTYKNIFPKDFSELQLNKGFVYSLFEKKESFISAEKEKLQAQIEDYKQMIENCKNELLESSEELDIVKQARYNKYNSMAGSPRRQQLQKEHEQWLKDTYPVRKTAIENKNSSKYILLENKLHEMQEQYKYLENAALAQILNRDNIDSVFQLTTRNEIGVENNNEEIKTNEYFPLLKFLMRNGYLDESYNDYMTFFYENSLTSTL